MPSRSLLGALCAAAVLAAAAPSAGAATDYAATARYVLAPGAWGGLPVRSNSTDQAALYDALTPLGSGVSAVDLQTKFLSEKFGVDGPVVKKENTGRPGLAIERDTAGVAHITGRTRADVTFGMGWVAMQDRGLLLRLGLGPAYAATLDIPGINAFGLVTSGRSFTPSGQARAFVARQAGLLRARGKEGRQILADFQSYADGVNAFNRREIKDPAQRMPTVTLTDAIAAYAFIGSIFGNGGGGAVNSAVVLAKLRAKFGADVGLRIFRELGQVNEPEATTSIPKAFPYNLVPTGPTPGSPAIDAGSVSASAVRAAHATVAGHRRASNALLLAPSASATGHGLAVMGPQLGYFYPEIVMQVEVHGGGLDAEGAAPPTMPYVLLGRGQDYAWSLTSAGNDNTDQFLERLCSPSGGRVTRASRGYVYKNTCRRMERFDAGRLGAGAGSKARELVFWQTVHGPVGGTLTIKGTPYAIATERATRGREPVSAFFFKHMSENRPTGPASFFKVANELETTFNIHYVDRDHIAYFSSGLLPVRAKGTDPALPTLGDGRYDWRGWLPLSRHPHQADPPSGRILNWNNKPAPQWGAADGEWGEGSVQRVELFTGFPEKSQLENVAGVMNGAATQDLRGVANWPLIARALAKGTAPSPQVQQAADLVSAWVVKGASRLDRDLDGKIDDPGATILDAAYPGLARAVLSGRLGPDLTSAFEKINGISNDANPGGSSYGGGWYSYVDKDLRTLLGDPVTAPWTDRLCGAGDAATCASALWAALSAAVGQLSAAQGTDPTAWRSDATKERIRFAPGLIPDTMRWTNRPTFQQAIEFGGHR